MAVGLPLKTTYVDGEVFSASDINDTNGTVNLVGQTTNFYAGKNKIINGDLGVWQRGTTFTPTDGSFMADRWKNFFNGTGSTRTYSQQSFTLGTAPVAGYEGTFFLRLNQSVAGTGGTYNQLAQPIESVRTFSGQTVTFSFWAKAAATTVLPNLFLGQNFGGGGSADVDTTVATNVSISTSWTRYSYTVTVPSISGKTIGVNNYLNYRIHLPLNSTFTLDFWGMQLEAGSTVTAFQTATGTIQGELAACQRYYFQVGASTTDANILARALNYASFSATVPIAVPFPVVMRAIPTIVAWGDINDGTSKAFDVVVSNYTRGGWVAMNLVSSGAFVDLNYVTASAEL